MNVKTTSAPYRTAAPTGATEPPAESVVSTPAAEYIGRARAKEIVLADLGVKETDIRDADCELERGRYEIDFDYGGYEYEYVVDALTGEIVSNRAEPDRDYRAPTVSPPAVTEPPAESVVSTPAAEYIGWARAKEIVLADLGVKETDIRDADCELERGRYEIDFDHGGYEYEYVVDALTGEILHREREFDR